MIPRANAGHQYAVANDGSGQYNTDAARVQTTNATPTTILNVPIAPDETIDITVSFSLRNTGTGGGVKGDSFGFDQHFRWQRIGTAAPTNWDTTTAPLNAGGAPTEGTVSASAVANGDGVSVDVQVTGVVGHTLNWIAGFAVLRAA